MKPVKALVIIVTILVASLPAAEAADPAASLADLAWLSGGWKMESSGRLIEEHWTTPAGGAMLGMSRTIKNGKMVAFEFLRIEQRDGGLFYIAQPQGAPPTEFRRISSTTNEWVFANPQHDFPQRIRYRRNPDGSVTARVEDESGKKGSNFEYRRAR
jgi:hypothetical protein